MPHTTSQEVSDAQVCKMFNPALVGGSHFPALVVETINKNGRVVSHPERSIHPHHTLDCHCMSQRSLCGIFSDSSVEIRRRRSQLIHNCVYWGV